MDSEQRQEQALESYEEGLAQYEDGDYEAALVAWWPVLEAFAALSTQTLSGSWELSLWELLSNMQALTHQMDDFESMKKITAVMVRDFDDDGESWLWQAVALKNTGDWDGARAAIEKARDLAPNSCDVFHELACIRAEDGAIDEAAAAAVRAIELGSNPADLVDDDELNAIASHPDFMARTVPEAIVRWHVDALRDVDGHLDPDGDEPDEDFELVESALPLTRRLLEESGINQAAKTDRGDGTLIVDYAKLDPSQQQVIRDLLQFTGLWRAIPFLMVLEDFSLPNTSVVETRRTYGIDA